MKYIEEMMARLGPKHALHISVYGDDNSKRLTGHHETSSCEVFSYGTANRAASFRIPTQTAHDNGKGYVEDRRPASNINPYVVGAIIADSHLLEGESQAGPLLAHFQKWQTWRQRVNLEKCD